MQADRASDVADSIRTALKHRTRTADRLERLRLRTAGCNRGSRFTRTGNRPGCNVVRQELGLSQTYVPAADPRLQIDIVPKTATR